MEKEIRCSVTKVESWCWLPGTPRATVGRTPGKLTGAVVPTERKVDEDGNGRLELILRYDDAGQPAESEHDLDDDGTMETKRSYRNGAPFVQEKDTDGDGRPDVVTEYRDGFAVSEKTDTDGDGSFDLVVLLNEGRPYERREDTNRDGVLDRFTEYGSGGQPVVLRRRYPALGRNQPAVSLRRGSPGTYGRG